jgi:hypothetical protein
MKIRAVKTELPHAGRRTNGQIEGQTEVTKLRVVFRNFAHASKKYLTRISWLVPFFSFLLLFFFFLFQFLYTFNYTSWTVRPLAMPPPATLFS